MPDAPRRSSTGTRRGPPKPHVPFRGENFDVAKKTGVRVQRAEVGSDGFEPFEDVVRQADTLTPYQVKGKKKKKQSLPEEDDLEDEDDGGGEEDMDLVDSPIHYIANARQPSSPPISRPSARSRPVSRSTNDLYDSIPSPHSAAHRSRTNGRRSTAGPSRLSQQQSLEDDFDMSLTTNGVGNYSDDDLPVDNSPSPSQQSFVALDNDDEEEEQEEEQEDSTPVPAPRSKSQAQDMSTPKASTSTNRKSSAHTPRGAGYDDFDEMEGDVTQLPDEMDVPNEEEEEEEEEPEEQPKGKKIRVEEPKEVVARRAKATTKGQSSSLKENRVEGVRRSQRKSYKPLQFWRNEKVVYGRPSHKNGQILVPHIREIIRIPEEPAEPLGAASKKRKRSTRSRSHAPEAVAANPEEGWDDDSAERGEVIDWTTKQLVEKRIACPPSKVATQKAGGAEWEFQKIFGDEQFIAAGQLLIPPKGRKPSKTTKDNTYVFCIMEGAVNVKINETSIILCTGGMFMVPRGNQYFIENISNRPARLFFAQARMVAKDDAERTASPEKPRAPPTTTSTARAGTAGPATSTAANSNSDKSRLKRANTSTV
ncbi:mitotic fidelity of chromosome transmission- protein [Marasmius sp. AFHP31]|nr:mitotic fidelity of chromosome transmission- protein [Marasmius sp. AFHP31]